MYNLNKKAYNTMFLLIDNTLSKPCCMLYISVQTITTMFIVVCFSSNCVINLSPDKRAVLKEAYSVMKVTPQTSGSLSFVYQFTI